MASEYAFGWRQSNPDFRDTFFATPLAVQAALPASVDLADAALPAPWNPTWDQGELGSCGPHSAAADLVYAGMKQQVGIAKVPMPSRLFIYWATRSIMDTVDYDSGVDNRSLCKALNEYGWADESLWPYDPGRFRERPSQAAFAQAAERKISQYLRVPQNLEQMRGCLAGGDPFIFGFTCYSSMMTPVVKTSGAIPMPRRGDQRVGGHDVLIVGYDDATRTFKIRNSWRGWGKNGYGTIPYEYAINPQLSADFWTVRHAALVSPVPVPPTPNPVPVPVPVPPSPPEPPSMFKSIFLKIVRQMVQSFADAAKQTPDVMDDMIAAMLLQFLDGLQKAENPQQLLAAVEQTKVETMKAFPQSCE